MTELTSRQVVNRIAGALAAISVLALLVGCGSSAKSNSSTTTSTAVAGGPSLAKCSGFPSGGVQPVGNVDGTLVEAHPTALEDFNPLSGGVEAWQYTTNLMYDALVGINPDTAQPYPDLASVVPSQANGGIAANGLVYTFHLRQGVKFADGTPFTSADVVYEYNLLQNPKVASPYTPMVHSDIAGVMAPDPNTVVFHLKHPTASFLYDYMFGIAPKHILDQYTPSQLANSSFSRGNPAQTFGTGPFRFAAIKNDDEVILDRNPHYFCGPPALEHYVFESTSDFATDLDLLQSGQINVAQIEPTALAQAKAAGLKTFSYASVFSTNLLFNLDPGRPTSSRLVRQALMYGTNRPAILAAAANNTGSLTNGVLDPKSFAYTNDVQPEYSYDPAEAERLLTQAGWTRTGTGPLEHDGQPLRIALWTVSGNDARDRAAAILQQEWELLGVQVTVNTEDASSLEARYQTTKDYDAVIIGLLHDLDPNDMQQTYGTNGSTNYNGYSNPRVDALLAQGEATLDDASRIAIYQKAQDLVAQDVPTPILWFDGNVRAETTNVHNVNPNGIDLDLDRPTAAWWWVSK